MKTHERIIHTVQPPAEDHPAAGNTTEPTPISYTPEQYGIWEAFTRHPDYELAKQQYARIFTDIYTEITEHAWHPEPQQAAFAQFIIRIFDGHFIDRGELVYGEGKRMFDAFRKLILCEDIPREKRLTAIRNLSEELLACADGAINSLICIVQQLQHHLCGDKGEVQRVREQLLEQLILKFHQKRLDESDDEEDEDMEKHVIAVYHNFLRPLYGLPSLEQDILADQASCGISDDDLNTCAEYVAARLTPMRIAAILAENYLGEVHSILPAEGLEYHQAKDTLNALKTRLSPLYSEISEALVLEEKDGRYHAVTRTTLLKLALLRQLQHKELVESTTDTPVAQYTMPDRVIRRRVPDTATGTYREEKQRLRGETISIYLTEGEFWLRSDQDPAPQFVTLSHLSHLFTDRSPYLTLMVPEMRTLKYAEHLMSEVIRNSTDEELTETLAAYPRLLLTYLQVKAAADGSFDSLDVFINLLSSHDIADTDRLRPAVTAALRKLNYTHLAERQWDLIQVVKAIYRFLAQSDHRISAMEGSNFLKETFFLNLYSEQLSLTPGFDLAFFSEPLIVKAVRRDWTALIAYLCASPDVNINEADQSGETALMLAAARGKTAIMQTLLAAGADISLCSPEKGNALCHAVTSVQVEAFEHLLRFYMQSPAGFDINARDSNGMTPLLYLFKQHVYTYISGQHREDMLLTLLKHGADARARSADGRSVLSMPSAFERDECYRILIDASAEIEVDDYAIILSHALTYLRQETAIAWVGRALARRGQMSHLPGESARNLLSQLIHINSWRAVYIPQLLSHLQFGLSHANRAWGLSELIRRFSGMSEWIRHSTQTEAVLLQYLQDLLAPEWIQKPDAQGKHFFDACLDEIISLFASRYKDIALKALSALIRHTDMTRPMKDGDTLLMHLVKHARHYTSNRGMLPHELHEIIRLLARYTTLPSLVDKEGFTPFMRAVQLSHEGIIGQFLASDPLLAHSRDAHGNTPLHIAAQSGQPPAIRLLLTYGAEVNARNNRDETAHQFALGHHDQEGANLLLAAGAKRYIQPHEIAMLISQ